MRLIVSRPNLLPGYEGLQVNISKSSTGFLPIIQANRQTVSGVFHRSTGEFPISYMCWPTTSHFMNTLVVNFAEICTYITYFLQHRYTWND